MPLAACSRQCSRDSSWAGVFRRSDGSSAGYRLLIASFSVMLFSFNSSLDIYCIQSSHIMNRYGADIRGAYNVSWLFFIWALLLIVHTWNSSPLRSNLLQLQCTCCTVPTISGRPHGSPLVWACQWPSSQPLSSPQLSHNDSLWA